MDTSREARLSRAQGCLIGQLAGDNLGALVEFMNPPDISRKYPQGIHCMVDGGTWDILAGQPTDDSEMALALARTLAADARYVKDHVLAAYVRWYDSHPFDCGNTVAAALRGIPNTDSQANGALMRISPLGIFCAGKGLSEEEVDRIVAEETGLTHPNQVCVAVNQLYVKAIKAAIEEGLSVEDLYQRIIGWARSLTSEGPLLDWTLEAEFNHPDSYTRQMGWVRIAWQNAVYQLLHATTVEQAIADTISHGGDTDTNAAICGALLGSVYGVESMPVQWIGCIESCCPAVGDRRVHRPRPQVYWPNDAFRIAHDLLESPYVCVGSRTIQHKQSGWDAAAWSESFMKAEQDRDNDSLHELRSLVFEDTVKDVLDGSYVSPSGKTVSFGDDSGMRDSSVVYGIPFTVKKWPKHDRPPKIEVINDDTLSVAHRLVELGGSVAVLNMASRQNPGGGVRHGAGAQEEYLFRCSNYFRSLYQFVWYASEYNLEERAALYPLDRDYGGAYSPDVTVFRGTEKEGYPKLEQPWKVAFIAVAALNKPELVIDSAGQYWLSPALVEPTKRKIRTIYRIALEHGHDQMVLGAFGCGAFANPPAHIARLFHEVLREDEFSLAFSHIVFAIVENHNSYSWFNPEGNFKPFKREFGV